MFTHKKSAAWQLRASIYRETLPSTATLEYDINSYQDKWF